MRFGRDLGFVRRIGGGTCHMYCGILQDDVYTSPNSRPQFDRVCTATTCMIKYILCLTVCTGHTKTYTNL